MSTAARVLVVGDSMLDRYWDGSVDRVSPEAPVLVLNVEREFARAGGAANVALNLVDLGSAVTLATLLGRDAAGARLAALLGERGVEVAAVSDDALKTTEKIRSVARRHQLLRIDFEQPVPASSVSALHERVGALLPDHPLVVLSDYAKGSLARVGELIAACAAAGCRVLVDPKGRDFTRYRGAFVVKPNAAEVRAIVGSWTDEADLLARLYALRDDIGVEHLLMTRGESGMTLVSAGGGCLQVPTAAREVYDVSGAGDTVLATLAHCLANGWPIEDAVRWANRAAGIVVGKFGTASVTRTELGLDDPTQAVASGDPQRTSR